MTCEYPRIINKRRTRISAWVDLIEKVVQFSPETVPEIFHFITQRDYVGIFARTADGLIPIVRQYRPSVEEYTWELPAGTVEDGETPEQAALRELLEEVGGSVSELLYLGNFYPDTGRVQVQSHAFFATVTREADFTPPDGLLIRYVTHEELKNMMLSGEFRHQVHLAIYAIVLARSINLAL